MSIQAAIAESLQLLDRGRRERAVEVLNAARTTSAPDTERYALGEALLRASNCREGWELYDLHPSRAADRFSIQQRWDGTHCSQLVLIAEQGFGDAIQFLRFVPRVAERADRVVLAIHDELYGIVRAAPLLAGAEVITKSDAQGIVWPPQTRWERLMSLPKHLNASAIATPISAYLSAPGTRIQIPAAPAEIWNVGVAWRSTPRRGFANRSIPHAIATKLAATGRLRPLVLHRDQDVGRLPAGAVSVGIRDFADTAAVIAQCRYVVTADTVTAHLAPALGVPTIICLRHLPDWRWGAPAAPTTWYDTARLTFQEGDEQWQSVLDEAVRTVTAAMPQQQ